jgi:NitT/TauT family transport system substrate-binding protein
MKSNFRKYAALGVALVALTSLAGCATTSSSGSASSGSTTKFSLATSDWIGFGPWSIAEKKGYFTKHGLEVDLVNISDSSAELAAVSSGKVDGANFATNVWLEQLQAGTKLNLVMLEDRSNTADAFLGGPGVKSVKDLVGKSVAYEKGSTSDLLFHYAVNAAGLDPASITQVELPADQVGAAMVAGKVQGGVTYEPYISSTKAQDSSIKTIYAAGKDPGLISDGLVVSPKYLKANPKALKAMTLAWDDSVKFLRAHPTQGQQIIADALGSSVKSLKSAFAGVDFYSRSQSASALSGDFVNTTLPDIVKASQQAGLLKNTAPDYAPLISTKFVK